MEKLNNLTVLTINFGKILIKLTVIFFCCPWKNIDINGPPLNLIIKKFQTHLIKPKNNYNRDS
jgi:hypothetical protein